MLIYQLVLITITSFGPTSGLRFNNFVITRKNIATALIGIAPYIFLDSSAALSDLDKNIAIIMTEVKRMGDEQKRMGDQLTALKNDVDGAKNFIGGVITLSGCSGAVATVVMTIDARVKEGKEERRREAKLAEEEKRREEKLAEEEKRREEKLAEEEKRREAKLAEEEKRREAKLAEEEKRREAKQSEEDKAKESRRGRAQD